MLNVIKDQICYLEASVTGVDGKFESGLTILYEVRKCSDNSLFASGTMSEIFGAYTASVTFTSTGEYRVKYTTPANYDDGYENVLVDDYANYKADVSSLALEATVQSSITLLSRALGLMQENFYIDNPIYDTNNNLTSGRIRVYSTAGSVGTDSNVLSTYTITSTYVSGKLATYKVVKV